MVPIHIRVKNNWVGKFLIFVILILIASLFSYLAITLFLRQTHVVKNSYPSKGVVASYSESKRNDKGIMYSPVVQYEDKNGNQQTFRSPLSSSRPSYKIGEKIAILIPLDGDIPQINSFMDLWFGPSIVSLLALLVFGILFFTIYTMIRNRRMQKLLQSKGVMVQAKILSVKESMDDKNKTLIFLIQAQWLDQKNNKIYTFESENFTYNPKAFLGETIEVIILPENPRIYKMNTSKIPIAAN